MSSENREEILADFQACTGIENVEEAINHLVETNWDLVRAVSRVMPPDSQAFQPKQPEPDVMLVEDEDVAGQSAMVVDNNYPSTSSARMLTFRVQFNDKVIPIVLPDTGTISDLKLQLNSELKIPSCRQLLSGWARIPQYENTPFSKLSLPEENHIQLNVKPGEDVTEENPEVSKLNNNYQLKIKFEEETFNLKYLGYKTVLDVKTDFYHLTNVQVRNQVWSGWPPNTKDQTVLAMSGINHPEHEFTVRSSSLKDKKPSQIVQIDSDEDEYEDASESFTVDDEYFIDNVVSKRMEPLIPENVEDEIVGCITFSEQFTARYGHIHPAFFQGKLEDAIREACSKPAKDRKILAIYLHHDASVLTNVFCTQLLGFESVMQMFENNFVLWGWDITFESNRNRLQSTITSCLGPQASLSVRNIAVDRLPAIVLIMKLRSSTEIFSIIHGNVGVNDFLSSLIEAVEVFSEHQRVEIKEEQERAERELVKWEQDQAYHESLEADRAKEEARRMQALKETEARTKLENEKAEELAKKEAFRREVEASLPPEPSDQGDSITKIRIRCPQGENLERRFLVETPLKVLLDFLVVKGYPTSEYKVISSWPRRDLTSLDKTQSLKDLKLCPQETVILEER